MSVIHIKHRHNSVYEKILGVKPHYCAGFEPGPAYPVVEGTVAMYSKHIAAEINKHGDYDVDPALAARMALREIQNHKAGEEIDIKFLVSHHLAAQANGPYQ